MTYKDLQKEVGDYTGVYTNLVLEDEMTWNVVGVLTNIIKCDCIGVKVSTRSLERHCNLTQKTVISAIGVLKKKGILRTRNKGYDVNYDALKVLIEKCNLKSKEITKASKSDVKITSPDSNTSVQSEVKITSPSDVKITSVINNNNINNNRTLYDTNMKDLSKEVKRTLYVTNKKEYIVPKVRVIKVNDYRTPSASRVTSLRNRIEVANKDLLCNLESVVEGSENYSEARECCFEYFKEYRDRLVNAARHPKCTKDEYDIISSFYERLNEVLEYYQKLIDKRYGVTSNWLKVHTDLCRYVHCPVEYEETPENFGLYELNEVS